MPILMKNSYPLRTGGADTKAHHILILAFFVAWAVLSLAVIGAVVSGMG